jgi:hypothetical protein
LELDHRLEAAQAVEAVRILLQRVRLCHGLGLLMMIGSRDRSEDSIVHVHNVTEAISCTSVSRPLMWSLHQWQSSNYMRRDLGTDKEGLRFDRYPPITTRQDFGLLSAAASNGSHATSRCLIVHARPTISFTKAEGSTPIYKCMMLKSNLELPWLSPRQSRVASAESSHAKTQNSDLVLWPRRQFIYTTV